MVIFQHLYIILEILTAKKLSPRSMLSAQLLLQLKVQLCGVKGCSAAIELGSFTGPNCSSQKTEKSDKKQTLCLVSHTF